MKLLIVSAFCVFLVPLGGAQANHTKPTRDDAQVTRASLKAEDLPETTLDFQPVGDGLPLSTDFVSLSHPVCSEDGTYYINAEMLPRGERQVIAVSPRDKDAVSNYILSSIMGLVNVMPRLMDAEGSDLYVLAGGREKRRPDRSRCPTWLQGRVALYEEFHSPLSWRALYARCNPA